jgi:hypothetical protein
MIFSLCTNKILEDIKDAHSYKKKDSATVINHSRQEHSNHQV